MWVKSVPFQRVWQKTPRFLQICKTCQNLKNCLFKPLFGQIINEGLAFVRISCYLLKILKKIGDKRQYFQAEKRTTGLCCSSNFAYWTKCTRLCSKIYFTFPIENDCLCCHIKGESFTCRICLVLVTYIGPSFLVDQQESQLFLNKLFEFILSPQCKSCHSIKHESLPVALM